MQTLGLPFHATAAPVPRHLLTGSPTVARKFPRRSLRLWPNRARRDADFRSKPQMPLHRIALLRHMAAIKISRAADENELADGGKRSVVPGKRRRAKASGATDRARASNGKVLATRSAR